MRYGIAAAAFSVCLSTSMVVGQPTTQPAANPTAAKSTDSGDGTLEYRATQAFNRGDYAAALPLLEQMATSLKDAPKSADRYAMVEEQIRVCKKAPAATPVAAAAKPAVVSKDDRKPHEAPKAGETREMAIKELGNFDYDPDQNTPIPDDVKALSGMNVRLRGYMIPLDQAENISKFALVPSLFNCCSFGGPPQMQHTIIVTCPKGKAITYFPDELVVEGKLKVDPIKDDGFIVGIFSLDAASVKSASK